MFRIACSEYVMQILTRPNEKSTNESSDISGYFPLINTMQYEKKEKKAKKVKTDMPRSIGKQSG